MNEKEGFWVWIIGIFFLVVLGWAVWTYGGKLIFFICLLLLILLIGYFLRQPRRYVRESIPEWMKQEVLKRQGGHCKYCEKNYPLQFHHIVPVHKGGLTTIENLECLCSNHHDSISRVR